MARKTLYRALLMGYESSILDLKVWYYRPKEVGS